MQGTSKGLQGQYAGFVSRAVGFIADQLIVVAVITIVNGSVALTLDLFLGVQVGDCPPLTRSSLLSPEFLCYAADWLRLLLTIIILPGYFALFWTLGGQTLGQYAMGVRVVRLNGQRMTLWVSLIRWAGYFVSFAALGLGFLWVLWDDRRQGFADKLAKTVVVYSWEAKQNEFLLDRIRQKLRRRPPVSEKAPSTPPGLAAGPLRLELVQAVFTTMVKVNETIGVLQDAIRSGKFQLVTSVVMVKDERGALGVVGSSDLAAGDQSARANAVLASDPRLQRMNLERLATDIPEESFVLWLVVEDPHLTSLLTTLTAAKVAVNVFDLDVPSHQPMSLVPTADAEGGPSASPDVTSTAPEKSTPEATRPSLAPAVTGDHRI